MTGERFTWCSGFAQARAWLGLGLVLAGAGCARSVPVGRPLSADDIEGQSALVEFKSHDPRVTLYLKPVKAGAGSGSSVGFRRVCAAPCQRRLPPGRYQVAFAKDEGRPIDARRTVRIDGPTTVKGKYRDFAATRFLGGVITLGAPVLGVSVMAYSEKRCGPDPYDDADICTEEHPYVGPGLLLFAGSLAAGIVLLTRRDKTALTISPGVARSAHSKERAAISADVTGLTVSGTF